MRVDILLIDLREGETERRSGIQLLPLARENVLGTTSFSEDTKWRGKK